MIKLDEQQTLGEATCALSEVLNIIILYFSDNVVSFHFYKMIKIFIVGGNIIICYT